MKDTADNRDRGGRRRVALVLFYVADALLWLAEHINSLARRLVTRPTR